MPIDETHPVMNTPKSNISLWRYMDIPSFLSLISSESLTFVRADQFEDKYEGTLPKITSNYLDLDIQQMVQDGRLNENYKNFSFSKMIEEDKKTKYLSCWCKENHEMIHMWKIYSKENGVAIITDYERLKNSIETTENIFPTEINYVDYEQDHIDWQANGLTAYTIKRKEYKSENEFRLIMCYPRIIEDQLINFQTHEEIQAIRNELYSRTQVIQCKVNLKQLISKIHISPYAPKWYSKVITDIVQKYNLNGIEIVQSDL